MLEITGDHIALLSDKDLRILVAILCEAELRRLGLATSSVVAGGDQDARDGGLDVEVSLPENKLIQGFIPAAKTGFQVKATPMPPAKIGREMCRRGAVLPAIQALANAHGAYVLVSSKQKVTATALENRRRAMRKALESLQNAHQLAVDFYDCDRLATWVRDHPGTIPWIREKAGKPIQGWQSYGNWASSPDGTPSEYLLDEKARIRMRGTATDKEHSVLEGISLIRRQLAEPSGVVRLVGLSGVGKTRLAQALFDDRVGDSALAPSTVFYTNMSDDPDPLPIGFLSDLVAARVRGVLVVDNCPPDLHNRLSEMVRSAPGSVRLLTVEYDIRDDLPEATEVFELRSASNDLIESLLKLRFNTLSEIDRQRIANFSEGNARIAIAATVKMSGTLGSLSDESLFLRLFQQRQSPDASLLDVGKACSLLYSFDGTDISDSSHLAFLGRLVSKSAQETFKRLAELRRRDLVQHRGRWRAILPHAIANRLAERALEDIPFPAIQQQLLKDAPEHIYRSFSHRLGFLHRCPEAISIVQDWLSPHGLLGEFAGLNDLGVEMFRNVAPVAPEVAVAAIERALQSANLPASCTLIRYSAVLRSLAYDPTLFDRCIAMMRAVVLAGNFNDGSTEEAKMFASLFSPYLSGTYATVEQRLAVIRDLLLSDDAKVRILGLRALGAALKTQNFFSHYSFDFGARSRDFGYLPDTREEVLHWYGSTLRLCESLVGSGSRSAEAVLDLIADHLRGLWRNAGVLDEIEQFCGKVVATQFWPTGWAAVRSIQHFDSKNFPPGVAERLNALESQLRPRDLLQQVRAIVFATGFVRWNFDLDDSLGDDYGARAERMENLARALGTSVARSEAAFDELLPEMFTPDGRTWSFGAGLAEGATDVARTWNQLVRQFSAADRKDRSPQVLRGYLSVVGKANTGLTDSFLEAALDDDALVEHIPSLECSIDAGQSGFNRLMRSLELARTPIGAYSSLNYSGATGGLPAQMLRQMILRIASMPGGFNVAIELLIMRLDHSGRLGKECEAELVDAGKQLLLDYNYFGDIRDLEDFNLGRVARLCLAAESDADAVEEVCANFRNAISRHAIIPDQYKYLFAALFAVQPRAALDGLLGGVAHNARKGQEEFAANPFLSVHLAHSLEGGVLTDWCDVDPVVRYPIAACGIDVFELGLDKIPTGWTPIALKLLDRAPDRIAVMEKFIDRFSPTTWWGSRATITEASAKLLDDVRGLNDIALNEFIDQQRGRIEKIAVEERRVERMMDMERDESFE